MFSLAEQITSASRYATHEADRIAKERQDREARMAKVRAKQWASRKAGGNGVADELLHRLPKSREAAISMAQVTLLMADVDTKGSSISGSLCKLVKDGRVSRIGKCRDYRYYVEEGKKS
jgi:hypothetical protein